MRKVLEACTAAVEQAGGRQPVEQRDRPVLKRICNTLEVGRFHENHLQLDESTFPWGRRLAQAAARENLGDALPGRRAARLPRRARSRAGSTGPPAGWSSASSR